jgi:histone H3/H4/DNA-directed RNA polymerase subunit RPC12/RpoP
MDVIFTCPFCGQELEADASAAGTEINCPTCGKPIVIPAPESTTRPPTQPTQTEQRKTPTPATGGVVNPIAVSAAAREEKHFQVPIREKPSESLINKPPKPLEFAAKETDKKLRVKTIRRIDCVEVGHDRFDERVTEFLQRVGENNIVSITPITYTYLDIATQKLITDFGVMIVYRG